MMDDTKYIIEILKKIVENQSMIVKSISDITKSLNDVIGISIIMIFSIIGVIVGIHFIKGMLE